MWSAPVRVTVSVVPSDCLTVFLTLNTGLAIAVARMTVRHNIVAMSLFISFFVCYVVVD